MFRKFNEIDFYSNEVLKTYNLDKTMRYQLSILDSLDAFTRKHSENVGNLACRLCVELKLDDNFTVYTTVCGFLHDIGKVFIPPKILQKPSVLTSEEYEIMKTHATIGYNMCMKDPKLRPYAPGPLYHHEGLDGTGYPQGISGRDIPLEGQIIRVADEFDAIVSKRQYKTHINIVETLNILIENTKPTNDSIKPKGYLRTPGKNDRQIVKALIKLIKEDTEMEIYHKTKYYEYLKQEESRYKKAMKYYKKMEKAKKTQWKEYYRQSTQGYLIKIENVDDLPQYYEEIEIAISGRKEEIKKLKQELRKIKRLKV